MPYKDPDKQREAVKIASREFRERKKAEVDKTLTQLKEKKILSLKFRVSELKNTLYLKLINHIITDKPTVENIQELLKIIETIESESLQKGNAEIDQIFKEAPTQFEKELNRFIKEKTK